MDNNNKTYIDRNKKKVNVYLEADQNLIKLCKKKKREGYELLYKKYEKYIYKICYYYSQSKEDALDLLQEIYLKIFNSIEKFDDKKSILPWIKKISVNTFLNFVRLNKKNVVSLDTPVDGEKTVESSLSSNENTENNVVFKDTKEIVEDSIRELPEEMRMAIILRHVKGMSYSEIGEAMSCPVGTVKTYIFRGRTLLKNSLKLKGVWEI